MRSWLLFLLLLPSLSAQGAETERETFTLIGWNDACSAAFVHEGYPALGRGIYNDPVFSRIGTLTIPPGADRASLSWEQDAPASGSWDRLESQNTVAALQSSGYDRKGFSELLPDRIGSQPGLDAILLSSAAFALRLDKPWPGSAWHWRQVYYSPLSDCGLFVFTRAASPQPAYLYLLARIYDPTARPARVRAHISNARLLLEAGDMPGAVQEAAVAVGMAPDNALARYQNAAILCLNGDMDAAQAELAASINIDPAYKKRARLDSDFESLSGLERFQLLTRDQQ